MNTKMEMNSVFIIGDTSCGKTKLLSALMGEVWVESHTPTPTFNNATQGQRTFFDISFDVRSMQLVNSANIVIIAVDLSKPDPLATIQHYLDKINDANSLCYKPVILVGCKSDIANEEGLKAFKRYQALNKVVTSAKEQEGIDLLTLALDTLTGINLPKPEIIKSDYETAKDTFLKEAEKQLSPDKYRTLCLETAGLDVILSQESHAAPDQKLAILNTYQKNCQKIINGRSNLLKGLGVVVITAVVGIFMGSIGFGFGFMAGLWTGPGAFLTALMGGNAFAVAATAFTLTTMLGVSVATSTSFFGRSSLLQPQLDAVIREVKSFA